MTAPVPSPAPHGYDYLLHKWTGRCPYGDVCSGCDALGYCTRAEPREEMNEPLTCPRCGSEEHGGDVSYDGCSDCRHPAAGSSVPDTSGREWTYERRFVLGVGWQDDVPVEVPASGLPAVREPDEATILREAVSWAHWPVGKPQFHRSDMLAALDRLVADRDRWKWGRDWQAEKATAWAKRCFAAEAEVAVLTARLTEADEALRLIADVSPHPNERIAADQLRNARNLARRARAALAGERGDRHNEDGGLQSRPCESGQA